MYFERPHAGLGELRMVVCGLPPTADTVPVSLSFFHCFWGHWKPGVYMLPWEICPKATVTIFPRAMLVARLQSKA